MNDTLATDPNTGIITNDAIANQVKSLIGSGVIPKPPMDAQGNMDMDKLMAQDGTLYQNLQAEFCWYESVSYTHLTLPTNREV